MLHEEKFNLFLRKYRDACTKNSKKLRYWYISRSRKLDPKPETFKIIKNILILIKKDYLDKTYTPELQYNLLKDLINEGVVAPYKDKGSHKEGSALVRGYKVLLQTLGLIYLDNHKKIIITDVGNQLIDLKKNTKSVNKIISKQTNKYQYPNPSIKNIDYDWFKEGLIPSLFLIEVLSQIKKKQITKNEFLLFVNLSNSMNDIEQTVDWIKSWRHLSNNEKENFLKKVKKIKKGKNVRWNRVKQNYSYMTGFFCFPKHIKYDKDNSLIKLDTKEQEKDKLEKVSKIKVPIYYKEQEYEWYQYYGDIKSKPDWLNYISLELKRASSAEDIKKTKEYKDNVKKLSKKQHEEIVRQEREKHIEDYYIQHLDDIEDGLQPYHGKNPNENLRHPSRQFSTATGPIDILCKGKNGDIVVLEIKVDEAKDSVFGQILRYIGCIKSDNIISKNKNVRGIILAGGFSDKARYSRIGLPTENQEKFIKFIPHHFSSLEEV